MRIKKYENASSPIERLPYIRNYQWRIMPQIERKYKDYYLDSDVLSGDKVWTDEQGNIVTTDTPNAAADFAVQYRNPRFELDYPEITIEGNGKGYFTGESFADRYARELAAPIAKNVDVDNTFKEQALWLHEQSKEKHDADVKAADARANLLTPGVGTFVVAPVAATLAGIGGATLAPFLVPGTIGGNIIGTTAFGEALNQAMKYGTGKTLGEHAVNAARYLGIPESQWGDFGILMIGDLPFYVTGDLIGKQVANAGRTLTKEVLDQLALDNTFKGIPINPTTKDLAKAVNKEVKNKLFNNLIPGQIGWAPRQTLTGYHASNEPIQEFNYWYPNWAVKTHNAPHGIYFTANETRPSGGFLAKRPYIEQVSSTFDRPMVQVGEIPASAKNATRNAIEQQALSMGADGIIYQGIKDNQLENQTIVKALNPDLTVNVSEIVENNPYQITKVFDNIIPLSQRDNFNLSDTRYWKDSFGEEILEEPYPGSDMEILAALGKGMEYGIDYRKSPEHLRQILETMGWDDLAMSEYIQEQKDLTGRISAEVSGFDEGMINKGKHRSGLNANGKVIHLIFVNRDRMPTSERVIEAGVHEMGGHGMTGGISPENLHGLYLQLVERFPRTLELMLKNEQLKNQTLVYNDTMKEILTKELYKKVEEWRKQGLTDEEIESKAILWGKLKNKKIPYISDTNEITTRAITENVIRNLGLTNSSSGKFNSLGMQEASDIFTPESLEKFIKVALSNIGITYGLSQLNQPTSNRKGGKLIPRKYGIGGYVTDLLGLNKEGSFLTKASSKLGELASKAEKPLSYLNLLSPTSVAGAVGRKIMGNPEPIMNLIRKGTGITTSAFSEAHPIASLALNLGLDFVTDPFTLVGSIGKINLAGKIGKAATRIANKTEMLTHLSKLLTTSAVTPERQRLWKCLMYITNGRPSEGFKLAKARLSGDELSDMLKYILTGDAQAFSRLKPGFTGFIEKGRKPELWYERYTTASPSSNEIELTDLTLGIVDSKVNVPALYEQLSKASPLLSKDLAISIRGGEIIGTKQAIKNQGLLKMLNGEDVPLGIIPIVADNYLSGIRALQRLNNETPIMSYSLRTHLIKTAKRGQEGMFNTGGMHCYIYADGKGKLRLVEADIFKNTASGITKKYSGIFGDSSIKDIGKRIALNRYNSAEQTGVVILREKRLETNDLLNALALLEKRIYEGRSALKRGDITENEFLTLRTEISKTENRLREMLIQQKPKNYILNLTEVNSRSRKLIGKPDKKGHWGTPEDAHIESTVDKIIETLGSKYELTRLSADRNRIKKIITQAMEIGENQSRLKRTVFTSLVETPETINPRLKAMFRTIEPEKYAKASKLNRARKFSDSPQDNIVFLFSEGKTYVPKTLDLSSKNNVDNQIKNTIYAIQNYSTSDPKSRELITKAIDEGFTLFDPEKMKSPETFYNTLKECKQLFSDKLSELIPNVDKKISSNLHRSQKLIVELPNVLKYGGKINP